MSLTGGSAARPGKVVGSVMRYNNDAALEQRRVSGRNSNNNAVAAPTQFPLPASSYPRRSSTCKNDKVETTIEVSSNGLQARPPYIPRKVVALKVVLVVSGIDLVRLLLYGSSLESCMKALPVSRLTILPLLKVSV